jgi:hypothetical protein|tara:strand:- start:28 stop:267 length:240 start_codon:yes stop_codon:yes gene_type:complete
MKTTLDKDQLDYLIGETRTEKRRLQNANRDAKIIVDTPDFYNIRPTKWIWAWNELDKINKRLKFINNLLTDLQDMKGVE